MIARLNNWLLDHAITILIALAMPLVGVIWWASRIDDRVTMIESRGSPQAEALANQLTTVEVNQRNVIQRLGNIDNKLDEILLHHDRSNQQQKDDYNGK